METPNPENADKRNLQTSVATSGEYNENRLVKRTNAT